MDDLGRLQSKLINCSAIPVRSSESQEVHFYQHRMEIVEQRWEEEKLNVKETVFVKSKIFMDQLVDAPTPSILDSLDSLKVPILGSSGAAILVVILIIILVATVKLSKGKDNNNSPVIVQTSAVAAPIAFASAPVKEIPPVPQESYNYAGMDVQDIINIPVLQRTATMREIVARHTQRGKT